MPAKPRAAPRFPTGTVTYLFTDLEGSTRLWERRAASDGGRAGAPRRNSCASVVEAHGGRRREDDGRRHACRFADPHDALATRARVAAGRCAEPRADAGSRCRCAWGCTPARRRARDGDYFGPAVNRAARIMGAAHGGQVLLSQAVAELVHGRLPARRRRCATWASTACATSPSPERRLPARCATTCAGRSRPCARSTRRPTTCPQQLDELHRPRARDRRGQATCSRRTRLLTLTGPGGTGKTRLVAAGGGRACSTTSADGVWLVELAPLIATRACVPQAVATVLGRARGGRHAARPTRRRLPASTGTCSWCSTTASTSSRACAAARATRSCASARTWCVLATSREPLARSTARRIYPRAAAVDARPTRDVTPESRCARYEAVRLFIERAAAAQPRFALDANATRRAVRADLPRLDGIPLAIELAAARCARCRWSRSRAPRRPLPLLTGGNRAALPRQQTLRALIDWSYDLLDGRRAGAVAAGWRVFAGGFTRMVGRAGFEPATNGLKVRCSTN